MEVVKTYEEKYQKHIPVVTAGGIYTHEDVKHQFELGAEGVQVATRFVTTEECDAPDAYKQAYNNTKKEEITSLAFRCDLRKGMKGFLLSCLFD